MTQSLETDLYSVELHSTNVSTCINIHCRVSEKSRANGNADLKITKKAEKKPM